MFHDLCEDNNRLTLLLFQNDVSRQLQRLEVSMTLLEAKLASIPGLSTYWLSSVISILARETSPLTYQFDNLQMMQLVICLRRTRRLLQQLRPRLSPRPQPPQQRRQQPPSRHLLLCMLLLALILNEFFLVVYIYIYYFIP